MHACTDARHTFSRIACKARIEWLILTFLRFQVQVDARHIHRASILTYKHSVQKHKYIYIYMYIYMYVYIYIYIYVYILPLAIVFSSKLLVFQWE